MRFVPLVAILLAACGDDSGGPATADAPSFDASAAIDASAPDAEAADAAPVTVTIVSHVGSVQADVPFLAAHDGDGAWQALSGAGGVYAFDVSSGRYGVAWVCESAGSSSSITIWEVTLADAATVPVGCTTTPSLTYTMTGTVSGLSSGQLAQVQFGPTVNYATAYGSGGGTGTYTNEVAQGTWDVGVARTNTVTTDRVLLDRDVTVFGDNIRNFDLTSAGVATVSHTLTVVNGAAGGEELLTGASFIMKTGGTLYFDSAAPAFVAVPSASLLGNDVHTVQALANDAAGGTQRAFQFFAKVPTDTTVALPPVLAVTFSVPSTDPVLFRTTFADEEADVWSFSFQQTSSPIHGASAWVAKDWFRDGAAHTYTFPDLTELDGWNAAWNPPVASTRATAWRYTSNRGVAGVMARNAWIPAAPPSDLDGLQLSFARVQTTISP